MEVIKVAQYDSDTSDEEIIEKNCAKIENKGAHTKTKTKFWIIDAQHR